MRISAQAEALLIKNIIFLHEERNFKYGTCHLLNLKGVMFDQKISMLKSRLQRQHKDLYKKHEQLFDDLITFMRVRNNMDHSYFEWKEDDLKHVTIWELQLDEEPHFYKDVKYSLRELNQTFKDLVEPLIDPMKQPYV